MSKEELKRSIQEEQGGIDPLTGSPLSPVVTLVDTDRIVPKAEGGEYTRDNTRVVSPVAHMARHGNLRRRAEQLEEIKSVFDDRTQIIKLELKINNQILAFERRVDHEHKEVREFLEEQLDQIKKRRKRVDRGLAKLVEKHDDPLARAALSVPGLGPITIAALIVYIDIKKAPVPSSLWRYCGLDKPSHERYTKGETSGGNKTLRTVLWNTANVMVRGANDAYRLVYDRTKARLEQSEKIVKTRNTEGLLVEQPWKETKPSHRHGAALRAIMKHILSDFWYTARKIRGLPTRPTYAEEYLGHTSIVSPGERGWPVLVPEEDRA